MFAKWLPDKYVPKDIPKGLISALIWANLLIGLSGMRFGGKEGMWHTLENWIMALIIIPCCTALVATPLKYRDPEFDIKLAYYLGMLVAFLFMLGKLRYWR